MTSVAVATARFPLPLLIWLVLLAGCATRTDIGSSTNPDFNAHQAAVLALPDWQLAGRLNVRQGNQSDTVSINWQQQDEHFDITLSSTVLGLGTTRVSGSDNGLVVEKAGEPPVSLPDLQALTSNYLGFGFPAANLVYWVRGLPVPGMATTTGFDAGNLLTTLTQRDSTGQSWQLTYDRHAPVDGLPMPGRIRLSASDMQLTFLVREWHFAPATP